MLQNLLKALQGLVPEAGVDPFGGQAAGSRSDKATGDRASGSAQRPAPTTGNGSQQRPPTSLHLHRSFVTRSPIPNDQSVAVLISKVALRLDVLLDLGLQGGSDHATSTHSSQLVQRLYNLRSLSFCIICGKLEQDVSFLRPPPQLLAFTHPKDTLLSLCVNPQLSIILPNGLLAKLGIDRVLKHAVYGRQRQGHLSFLPQR